MLTYFYGLYATYFNASLKKKKFIQLSNAIHLFLDFLKATSLYLWICKVKTCEFIVASWKMAGYKKDVSASSENANAFQAPLALDHSMTQRAI